MTGSSITSKMGTVGPTPPFSGNSVSQIMVLFCPIAVASNTVNERCDKVSEDNNNLSVVWAFWAIHHHSTETNLAAHYISHIPRKFLNT